MKFLLTKVKLLRLTLGKQKEKIKKIAIRKPRFIKSSDQAIDLIPRKTKKERTNQKIRLNWKGVKEGKIIFNYSRIHGTVYLRCVILDPEFTHKQLKHIIENVVEVGSEILN